MGLDLNQIKELLKNPENTGNISKAAKHEKRLRFHIDTSMSSQDAKSVYNDFIKYAETALTEGNYYKFLYMLRFPVYTNEVCDQIFHTLQKVNEGIDSIDTVNFTSEDAKEDYNEFDPLKNWNIESFEKMQGYINSVLIADLPQNQDLSKPEPYYYFKNIDSFYSIGSEDNVTIDNVLFINEDILFVFDDEYYRTFRIDDKREIIEVLSESKHELTYCPARFLWTDYINSEDKFVKKSPLSTKLTDLDDLLFDMVNKRSLDLHAAYPIYWVSEVKCDYKGCDGGFLKDTLKNEYIIQGDSVVKCPLCTKKRMAGAGTVITKPTPRPDEKESNTAPIGILPVDAPSLQYTAKSNAEKKLTIIKDVTGSSNELINQAVNEKQVIASLESQTAVLNSLKHNFESSKSWLISTICNLRYGNLYVGNTVSYGTKFDNISAQVLAQMYNEAKGSGLSDIELDAIQEQRIYSIYKNNPEKLNRAKLLLHLEPYRHLSKKEVLEQEISEFSLFSRENVAIKLNFSNFISRFEREQLPITQFGSELELSKRIDSILKIIKSYVEQ